ncbi:glycosyltransferase [Pinibacter aurantiacus]|uniref:Glycosyltransferase n=1 Tax=Pinibacter aurantiacus TaxID=2851599 RepID=A0A9E2W3A8_9BACT|nr:glycosyltransferase [Pinibacter aurantiacus]MBV4358320.1 glycosyltransferase [Pinibacter aurantiacus]
MKKRILFLIGDDPNYDQRMQKICSSLVNNNYEVLLAGIAKTKNVKPLISQSFEQRRFRVFSKTGFLLFAEVNFRLFFNLLFTRCDAICAIDLDTIMPAYFLSVIKGKKRIHDAHELFCEMPSVALRPRIHKFWKRVEKTFLPKFKNGYTVNESLAKEYNTMYELSYEVIMNAAVLNQDDKIEVEKDNRLLLYQGAIQAGRGIEYIIQAMTHLDAHLVICGKGDYFEEAKRLTSALGLQDKIEFKGYVLPADLKLITQKAFIGLNTTLAEGKSYYLSLSNRTFDYMHALTPQIAMDLPEYAHINSEFEVALLIKELSVENIVSSVRLLMQDEALYNRLQQNCKKARLQYNWQHEEKKLISFYNHLFKAD